MKQPSIPLTIAYKIVQVDARGRMWSVNLKLYSPRCKDVPADLYNDRIVRYQLRHQVLPNTIVPLLFVCPTKEDAMTGCEYYDARKHKYVLRGYAANLKAITKKAGPHLQDGQNLWDMVPLGFSSAVCDWFIPIGIVHKIVPAKSS